MKEGFLNQKIAKRLIAQGTEGIDEKELASMLANARQGHPFFPSHPPSKEGAAVVFENGHLYLQKNWSYETLIAGHLRRIQKASMPSLFDLDLWEEGIKQISAERRALPTQIEAIAAAFKTPLFILYGGPGSGKTYTASLFVELLSRSLKRGEKLHICLTAPTGKAAAHLENILKQPRTLSDQIEWQSLTLHSLLKLQPGENHLFKQRPIDADLILVDESSMLDIPLLAHLLEGVIEGTRLIFLGDPNQLPPVEQMSLFPELAKRFGQKLEGCVRTGIGELIELSQSVLTHLPTDVFNQLEKKGDAIEKMTDVFCETVDQKLLDWIRIPRSEQKLDPVDAYEKIQLRRILNPLRKGPFGADRLNQKLFELLESQTAEGIWVAVPILLTSNDSYQKSFNGMTGVLLKRKGCPEKEIYLGGEKAPLKGAVSYEIAFCLSVHKSQGSEFEEVLALFPAGSERFGREIFYTAVTRTKKKFFWAEEKEKLVVTMLENTSAVQTSLLERL